MASIREKKFDIPAVNTKDFESFTNVGGLSEHIRVLRELVIFPLLYAPVYSKFNVKPPRGVIFHGPPGTGKTLLAGALAKECSKGSYGRVNFFPCKGPEILNKWFGESEQRLRNLFIKASQRKPSIIFFDEIDGIAPVRSDRQDQSHTTIVSTLLTLMDGLDKLSGVVVIGSTNRIDAIDPALRRPGRFDRELYFPLPAIKARKEILDVHISCWSNKPTPHFLNYLAEVTTGYSGSDLRALCSEAVMNCLRRNYPGIHGASRICIRMKDLRVEEKDFIMARSVITPAAHREVTHMRRLSSIVQPLLHQQLKQVLAKMQSKWPHFTQPDYKYQVGCMRYAGRLLLMGGPNQGHNTHMAPALLHAFEHLPSYVIDIRALYENAYRSSEEICVQKLTQAKRNLPALVLAYRLDEWWDIVQESTRAVLISMLEDLHACLPLLVIATATNELPACLMNYFTNHSSIFITMQNPNEKERKQFLYSLFMENAYTKCLKYSNPPAKCGVYGNYLYPNGDSAQRRSQPVRLAESSVSMRKYLQNRPSFYKREKYPHGFARETRSKIHLKHYPSAHRLNDVEEERRPRSAMSNVYKLKKSKDNYIHKRRPTGTVSTVMLKKTESCSWFPITQAMNLARHIQNSITNMGSLVNDKKVQTHYVNKNFPTGEQNSNEETNIGEAKMEMQQQHEAGMMHNKDKYAEQMKQDAEGDNIKRNSSAYRNNYVYRETSGAMPVKLKCLFRHAVTVTTKNMTVAHLELFYDMLSACINRENQDVPTMLVNIANIMADFEVKTSNSSE